MSDETNAPGSGGGEPATVITLAADTPKELSVSEAARALRAARKPPEAAPIESAPAPAAEAPPEQPELADEANAAPPEEAPSGDTPEIEPAEAQPPIEPPRSWTKDVKERWAALPRDVQEEVARIEQSREREVRRTQNETAEKLKGLTAKEQEVEKARQEYEAKLPAIMQMLQSRGEFADIKSMDDVKKLQMDDPFRFQAWQLHQMELQAVDHELKTSEQRKAVEHQSKWTEHVEKENALIVERIPEFADKAKAKALQDKAVDRLTDLGFTQSELADLASGKERLSIYDHRIQLLLVDSMKLADVQKAKTAALAKPVPQVQRPGVAKAPNASAAQEVQALQKQLDNATGNNAFRLAAQLLKAQRRAGAR